MWSWLWDFILTPNGFCKIRSPKSGAGFPSDITYSVIIDPTKSPNEKAYPISRKILTGDAERFHILVGSPISCHLHLKFKFLVGETQIIESEVFDIKIWNPRNAAWHNVYKDGQELHRDFEKQKIQMNSEDINLSDQNRIQRLEQKVLDYPFISDI